ncbi:MauE/DoxX family redox-associated membrane protein [Streptomyces diastatochromogenes]|uniref:MauE/DoxX family redox-associated membrane protein n=1 Tax=Streptomyces diastatochromogenes TaxID=42236 RepID=UPI002F26441C
MCLFLTFMAFSVSKVIGFRAFRDHVRNSVSAMPGMSLLVAGSVIVAELLACGLLLWNATAPEGFALMAVMLIVFTAYLCRLVARGRGESCGCSGESSGPITLWHISRNVLLFLLSVGGLLASLGQHNGSFDGWNLVVLPVALLFSGVAYFLDYFLEFFKGELL